MLIFKKYKGNKYTGYTQYRTEKRWNDFLPDGWKVKTGGRIIFLPRDIDGLQQKLMLLLGEYHAGNTTTYNEIVAILDELKRQNAITEQSYKLYLRNLYK